MFRKEYPPMIQGSKPDENVVSLRGYLVRLVGYIDDAIREVPNGTSEADQAALTEWQTSVDEALNALRNYARSAPQLQFGSVSETGNVTFPKAYTGTPVVFSTAGTISDVSATGFTLTTSSAAQWIAVGDQRR